MDAHDGVIPDFVIKKRPKRHAVDPCLGFYTLSPVIRSPPSPDATNRYPTPNSYSSMGVKPIPDVFSTLVNNLDRGLSPRPPSPLPHLHLLDPQIASIISDPYSNILTVEKFLQRSSEKPKQDYSRKRRRVVDLEVRSPSIACDKEKCIDGESSDAQPRRPRNQARMKYVLSSDSEKPDTIQPRTKKKTGTFAGRMVRAAMLAHVQPAQIFENNMTSSTRQPLSFVRQDLEPSASTNTKFTNRPGKRRMPALIDPRKATPFGHASFPVSRGLLTTPGRPKHKPITKWMSTCNEIDPPEPPRRRAKPEAARPKSIVCDSRCPPLSFVRIHEGEKALSLNRSTRRAPQLKEACLVSDRTPLIFLKPPLVVTPQASENISCPSRAPTKVCRQTQLPSSPVIQQQVKISSVLDVNTYDDISVHLPTIAASEPLLDQAAENMSTTSDDCLIPPSDILVDVPIPSPRLPVSPRRTIDKKPLKTFASFLDDFLETARNATQKQASIASRLKLPNAKYKETSKRVPAIKSLIHNSIRTFIPRPHDPPSYISHHTDSYILSPRHFTPASSSVRSHVNGNYPFPSNYSSKDFSRELNFITLFPSESFLSRTNDAAPVLPHRNEQNHTSEEQKFLAHQADVLAVLQRQYEIVLSPSPSGTKPLSPRTETTGLDFAEESNLPIPSSSLNFFAGFNLGRTCEAKEENNSNDMK